MIYKANGGNGRVAKSLEFEIKIDEALGLQKEEVDSKWKKQ